MEVDLVLLVDVDEENYPTSELNAKLLYVGCTRALHSAGHLRLCKPPKTSRGRVVILLELRLGRLRDCKPLKTPAVIFTPKMI
jgi:hypothetical protein